MLLRLPYAQWQTAAGARRAPFPTYIVIADNDTAAPIAVDLSARFGAQAAAVNIPPHTTIIEIPDDCHPFGPPPHTGLTTVVVAGQTVVVGVPAGAKAQWDIFHDSKYVAGKAAYTPGAA